MSTKYQDIYFSTGTILKNFSKGTRNIGSFLIIHIFTGTCKFTSGIAERRGKRLVYRFKYMY